MHYYPVRNLKPTRHNIPSLFEWSWNDMNFNFICSPSFAVCLLLWFKFPSQNSHVYIVVLQIKGDWGMRSKPTSRKGHVVVYPLSLYLCPVMSCKNSSRNPLLQSHADTINLSILISIIVKTIRVFYKLPKLVIYYFVSVYELRYPLSMYFFHQDSEKSPIIKSPSNKDYIDIQVIKKKTCEDYDKGC